MCRRSSRSSQKAASGALHRQAPLQLLSQPLLRPTQTLRTKAMPRRPTPCSSRRYTDAVTCFAISNHPLSTSDQDDTQQQLKLGTGPMTCIELGEMLIDVAPQAPCSLQAPWDAQQHQQHIRGMPAHATYPPPDAMSMAPGWGVPPPHMQAPHSGQHDTITYKV